MTEVAAQESECRRLFARVERLPLAVSVLASSIKYDVRYTIKSLAAKLPTDVTALIKEVIEALPSEARRLLIAMSACAAAGFRLALAAALINMNDCDALDAVFQLASRSLVEEINREQRRYRIHSLVRAATADGGSELAEEHAKAVNRQFKNWETDWQRCEEDLPDFKAAVGWGLANKASFVESLAYCGYSLTERIGRLAEAFGICELMGQKTEPQNESVSGQGWFGNQALILIAWSRLDEALALLKKEESLCLELGKRDDLQRVYGSLAGIALTRGSTEDALDLYKKQEIICVELDNKDSLQRSFGGQALALKKSGLLKEAMSLHKKEEARCLELGNGDGLQRSFGNQALILLELRDLEEALALLHKKEALCLELGNKASLGHCYWNWGSLAHDQEDFETEWKKLNAALAIFTELKMPRERDAVAAQLAKAHSAGAP